MLLVTKSHHERDETKVPDRLSLQDIGQVELTFVLTYSLLPCVMMYSLLTTMCDDVLLSGL